MDGKEADFSFRVISFFSLHPFCKRKQKYEQKSTQIFGFFQKKP